MSAPPLSEKEARRTVDTINEYLRAGFKPPSKGGHGASAIQKAAADLHIASQTLGHRLKVAKERFGLEPKWDLWPDTPAKPFEIAELPSELPGAEELLQRRRKEWQRKSAHETARSLISVKIKIDGPIGIVHMGDPHVDDPGTNIDALEQHVDIINRTEGMFGANVGDLQNNWVGRLARLYGEQSTSAAEAWVLTEWLVRSVKWLYLIGGNHDLWSGSGDPVKWIAAHAGQMYEGWGARLNLVFPNKKEVRVNARHDFAGNSMWNTAHGVAKAVQMGWRDHIATCGHRHTSGYQILKDPSSGLISHALRIAGYKVFDRYAKELGLPNQNVTPAVVTIIDPTRADDDPRLVTVINDVELGADVLTWLRRKK
jgi:hypothetical protein